jgi:hypothetical protein
VLWRTTYLGELSGFSFSISVPVQYIYIYIYIYIEINHAEFERSHLLEYFS